MKKLCILLVALVMVFVCAMLLPTEADAATTVSGTCGKNLRWTLDATGTLTISGSGEMTNYDWWEYNRKAPWYSHWSSIKHISIQTGVTNIGDYAFYGCKNVISIEIPNSVTCIGERALEGCMSLTSISIPESITAIDEYAFVDCSSLTGIWVDSKNPIYCSDNHGVLFNKETATLVRAHNGLSSSYIIPDGTKHIGVTAFEFIALDQVIIPSSVVTIDAAFFDNYMEYEVSVVYCGSPDQWSSIEIAAGNSVLSKTPQYHKFDNDICVFCNISTAEFLLKGGSCGDNLTWSLNDKGTLTISGSGAMNSVPWWLEYKERIKNVVFNGSVTSIGSGAFSGCSNLSNISIPQTVTRIDNNAFYDCNNLTSIIIPDSVTHLGMCAFSKCDNLSSVAIGANVVNIPWEVFAYCTNLSNVTISNGVTSITDSAFYKCTSLASIVIPGSVTKIGTCVFEECTSLASVTLSDGVQYIGSGAFSNCTGLTSITIPDSVTSIVGGAFQNCDNLWHVLYMGSEQLWNTIDISKTSNRPLLLATIHYNCTGNEPIDTENKHCSICLANCTHTYDNDCDTVCNICDSIREAKHQYASIYTADENGHWRTCVLCANKANQAIHTPSAAATETTSQICTTCGYVIQAALGHTHKYSTDWSKDASGHWNICACGAQGNYTPHSYKDSCDTDCDVCGYTRTVTHTPGTAATATTDQVCTVCGKVLNKATGESTPTIPPTEPTTPSTEPTTTPTETPTEPATQPTGSATEPVTEPDATITPSTQESTPAEITEPNGDSSGAWVIGIAIAVVALGGAAVGIILWKKKH